MSASPATPASALAVPARHRLSSTDRRQQLLAHAIELFSKRGFSGTRTRDIAAAAGVSEGILFRHFATKEDLYHAILESHQDEAGSREWLKQMKRFATERNDAAIAHGVSAHIIRSFREGAAFHRLLLYAWLEGHSLADMAMQQIGAPAFDFFKKYIAQRQREGAFRQGDPGAMTMALYSPALQYGINKYIFGVDWLRKDDDETAAEFAKLLLAGMQSKTGQKK